MIFDNNISIAVVEKLVSIDSLNEPTYLSRMRRFINFISKIILVDFMDQ